MLVRIATIAAPKVSREAGIAFFRERVLPDLMSYDGFQDAMVLMSRDDHETMVLSFWDTEEDLRRAEATPAPHRTSAAREALGAEDRREVRIYELAYRTGEEAPGRPNA